MSRGSIRYVDASYMYGQHAVAAPVTNPVIYGRFPKYTHKPSTSKKINKVLSVLLLMLVVLSLVSYYFVSDSEKNMNKLGREIVALSNENIELQNKLDTLQSYYNIDDFNTIKDLEFLKDRKEVWNKFILLPKNDTLDHLLLANILRKKQVITEYIGFGRPNFTDNEKFFSDIFDYVSKKHNIIFNKTPLKKQIECLLYFELKHKDKNKSFVEKKSGIGEKNDEKQEDNSKKKMFKPNFSRKEGALANMILENSNYYLFYLNYEDLTTITGIERIDLIELLYFLRKRGTKIFINFFKKVDELKEEDNDIEDEHFFSNSINYIESVSEEESEETDINEDEKSKKMKEINNIYYLTDLYFFDSKQTPKKFNQHYQFFSADKVKAKVNKDNYFDYFIKGIATGTKDEIDKEKFAFFIEYFNKLYVIRADKKAGNKYEFDLKIHPQINHFNMENIRQYKKIIKKNKNYYISLILAFILGNIIENVSTDIETIFKGYLIGLEMIKKKIELEKNDISDIKEVDFANINIPNDSVDIKVRTLKHTGQEKAFILDCTNKEKSKLKDYVPLYDPHLINYLSNEKNINVLKKKGFINENGFIIVDPQYRSLMKDDEQNIENDKNGKGKSKNLNGSNGMIINTEDFQQKGLVNSIPTKRRIPNLNKPGKVYYQENTKTKNTKNNKNKLSENSKISSK